MPTDLLQLVLDDLTARGFKPGTIIAIAMVLMVAEINQAQARAASLPWPGGTSSTTCGPAPIM